MKNDDSQFRDKLGQHRSEVDIDELWGAIEPKVDQINERRKRRRFFLFFWGMAGVLLLGGLGVQFLMPSAEVMVEQAIDHVDGKGKSALVEVERTEKNTETSNLISKDFETQKKLGDKKEKTTPSEEIENLEQTNQQTKSTQDKQTKLITDLKNKVTPSQEVGEKSLGANREEQTKAGFSSSPKAVDSQEAPTLSIPPLASNSPQFTEEKKLSIFLPLSSILSPLPLPQETLTTSYKNWSSDEERPDRKNNAPAFNLAIEAYGGLAYAAKHWQANDANLLARRKATESALETTQLGALLEVSYFKNWSLAAGVQQTRINERFDYDDEIVETSLVTVSRVVFVQTNGDTIRVDNELPLTRTTTINQRIYNRYTMIDLPILFGYSQAMGKWRVGTRLGLWTNLSLRTKGQIRSLTGTENIKLAEEQDRVYVDRMRWSYSLDFHLERALQEHLSLRLSTRAHHYPAQFNQSSYADRLKEGYTVIGLNLALRYQLIR